ncbi:MAG: UDP-N-acetylglucosamine 1-carboxyvinyltransferase [Culicoidibacterales bacterium]
MAEYILIEKSQPLAGEVKIEGAKNAVLPIMAASLLAKEQYIQLDRVPELTDVATMAAVLSNLGAKVVRQQNKMAIQIPSTLATQTPEHLVSKMRASVLVMGALLAREGKASVVLPGGCAIGSRPLDIHLQGFEAMGATIELSHGVIEATVSGKLKGATIDLAFPSVGATENLMIAATLAEGTTILQGVAKEPEIVDLANFLNAMGASVHGAGTDVIEIKGVTNLTACEYEILPDRIEAGTFMVAAAITKGDIIIKNIIPAHLQPIITKLQQIGVTVTIGDDWIGVNGGGIYKATDIKTGPHPSFPTDMQSQFIALLLLCDGVSTLTETVFENRFMHVEELNHMGANIMIDSHTCIITKQKLHGVRVKSTDLRSAAGLILAGLTASGQTRVEQLQHLDRGYVDFVGKLQKLGAKVSRHSS